MSGNKQLEGIADNGKAMLEEYEDLLVRRDQLYKEAASYMVTYTKEFGDMITENFQLKVECIKKKKTISYCRRRMNRGLPIDTERMEIEIDEEMTLYYTQLDDLLRETEQAKNAETIGQFRYNRAKKIYRRLAKQLHPDINGRTMENEELKELWNRITAAYRISNVDELEDLEVLVRKTMEELGESGFDLDLSNIEERIERVERQINDILLTEPYTYGEILSDEKKKESLRERLREEHDDFERYLESLNSTLNEMLNQEGVKIVWKMN
ncbi:MAG: hypothetical protein K5989_11405 [Lachnospiraceae bacterium]|nr:hypothetical protein [Lachnospiraceae bacterium]